MRRPHQKCCKGAKRGQSINLANDGDFQVNLIRIQCLPVGRTRTGLAVPGALAGTRTGRCRSGLRTQRERNGTAPPLAAPRRRCPGRPLAPAREPARATRWMWSTAPAGRSLILPDRLPPGSRPTPSTPSPVVRHSAAPRGAGRRRARSTRPGRRRCRRQLCARKFTAGQPDAVRGGTETEQRRCGEVQEHGTTRPINQDTYSDSPAWHPR